MRIQSKRLRDHFEALAQYGKLGETGVCRPTLSVAEKMAFEVVSAWMMEAGMTVRLDHAGNLIGRKSGKCEGPILMMGSHLDSQPYGGRFDGTAGVLAAIEAVATMTEHGITPDVPIEVIAFCDEEGWRFNKGLFGSRAIFGQLEEGELSRTDQDGITREQALRDFGCDPEQIASCVYPAGAVGCYLELHIEQGPVLEAMGRSVGIVSGIAGPIWWTVTLRGFAGHAGSVPMNLRQDALVGAAEIILDVNRIVRQEPGTEAVGTVGNLTVFPNSRNIIPEEVQFTIDLRDIDQARRDRYEGQLRDAIHSVAQRYGLQYDIREDTNSEPRYCADWIKRLIREESKALVDDCPELMSGPFHDALAASYVCDYGMIFVRSKDGISHNPAEFSSPEDLAVGAQLLFQTAVRAAEVLATRGANSQVAPFAKST
ncbi:M20 family metallo-hydrolase [Alicyclobacillus fastidiosus]|uniref:M20 family metallo-hydrolase n=1 Tax=Alicyclobacillus fastidiosus TaxID=392011 RepID=A0ABY6ZE81_9BACL|nr:M20 family metallo-hydrolase [Alicyclobacillus fastidiosus]WAH41198.1 M20 family metallo-hydrolase [Alicyclobacillus fastidiosus]GMA62776.1 Zn-dependent hydrolase [Alicyclobacillus fastidiosus]